MLGRKSLFQKPDQLPAELLVHILELLDGHELSKMMLVNKTWHKLIKEELLNPIAQKYMQAMLTNSKLISDEEIVKKMDDMQQSFKRNPYLATRNESFYQEYLALKKSLEQAGNIKHLIECHPGHATSFANNTHRFFFKNNQQTGSQKFILIQPLVFSKAIKMLLIILGCFLLIGCVVSLLTSIVDSKAQQINFLKSLLEVCDMQMQALHRGFIENSSGTILILCIGAICYFNGLVDIYSGHANYLRSQYQKLLSDCIKENSMAKSNDEHYETIPLQHSTIKDIYNRQ